MRLQIDRFLMYYNRCGDQSIITIVFKFTLCHDRGLLPIYSEISRLVNRRDAINELAMQ